MEEIFKNAVEISRRICKLKLKSGDRAVDCTMGNGNDTAFLCNLVGEGGRVYAFDIQEAALINTRKRLEESNLLDRAQLICDGHQNMDKYVKEDVKLVIFNLGYLPRGDHNITTKPETTIEALRKSLRLLKDGGMVLLVIYYGHEGGREEKDAIESYTSTLDQKVYNVVKISFTNQVNNPPELICIEKRA